MFILYEVAFAYGSMGQGFSLYTSMPKTKVTYSSTVTKVASSSTIIIVESDAGAPDPMKYLNGVVRYNGCQHFDFGYYYKFVFIFSCKLQRMKILVML